MGARLLIVEDETPMAAFLRRGLAEEGFVVEVATDADAAGRAVAAAAFDLILLDVMLPGEDGFTLCARWRAEGRKTPILFLTARDEIADRVTGLNLGGDDYLVKPFAFEELLARAHALLRRRQQEGPPGEILAGDLRIDALRHHVERNGQTIALTAREYRLLEYLARRVGQVISRAELWQNVWEGVGQEDSNVVEVYVRYLRNKLGRSPDLIEAVRGAGYVLRARDVSESTDRRVHETLD